jgi:predicted aminopeptidase
MQAGKGQMALFNHARPIQEVVKDEKTPPRIRSLLGEISAIKKYGEHNGLKPTSNYTEYVKLDRNAAVWVVSACEPLEFKPKQWSFPLVGSFPYLGWFDRKDAVDYANDLKKEGLDVDVRGAGAYSTLGWFRDAVLSTMILEGEEALGDLTNVVLHESVHASLYIKGQSFFNESIASFVADRLTPTYLDKTRGNYSPEKLAYLKSEERQKVVRKSFHEAYIQLDDLYHSSKSEDQKKQEKQKVLENLKSSLSIKRDINNATLVQYKTYNTGQEVFEELLAKCGHDFSRLMKKLKELKPESFDQSQQNELQSVVTRLTQTGC